MVLLIMLDTLKRYLFDGARPIDRTMMIVELLVLLFVAYEAIVLFADRRREKRRLRDEEKGLEKFDPVVQEELKVFVLEGSVPRDSSLETIKKSNPAIICRDMVGPFIMPEHKQSLRKWALKNRKRET